MPYSNSSDIPTAGPNTTSEDDDDDQVLSLGFRIPIENAISSMRISVSSPRPSFASSPTSHLSALSSPASSNGYLSGAASEPKNMRKSKRNNAWHRKKKMSIGLAVLLGFFIVMNWWMLSRIQEPGRTRGDVEVKFLKGNGTTVFIKEELHKLGRGKKPQKTIYARLLSKAAHALAEGEKKPEPKDLWLEPYARASSWTPCAHKRDWQHSAGEIGYIMVTANGGINQQRVAVCNAVAIARLLNATLVLPKFMYSSVWRDSSQFGDIYQEDHFINYLKPDILIVKDLPKDLQSLDLEAIGSLVLDTDIVKEAKPSFYLKYILPILHLNRVVHFVGFGNRLASDPLPHPLQRIRQNDKGLGRLDNYLVGPFAQSKSKRQKVGAAKTSRYLALHLRFEIDMVAHSLCEFGGGEEEKKELEAYRELAALDFIVCSAADAFAMTDSGSQFSSLVAGYRVYYGGGQTLSIYGIEFE
ncbi:uncharacterized protein at1g04910 [Phtheirospermum japonicum]|uniref:O-fucosyltransferase family protein n=1 Tax=Phtheirospermum japonicum TaxID=374723 RepID=A0A830BK29_9LAMI|nr:uncharacterized protein at1g04910 [Phtheirospermum japonicum]